MTFERDEATAEVVGARYHLRGVLGQGSMGVVYRAFDEVLAREVALKELRAPADLDRAEAVDRFLTEARAAARLTHPAIVTVHDVFTDGDRVLLAMELLDGLTLAELAGPQPPESVRAVSTQIAEALATAHTAGIIHCDLKPENVFWLPNGRVVVCDFGLARIGRSSTGFGTITGTPGYLAPEVVRGEHLSAPADVFAWGAVCYELLAGRPPFGDPARDNLATLLWRSVHDPPPELPVGADPGLRAVIDSALAKDPAQRPADGIALLDALSGHSVPPITASTAQAARATSATPPGRRGWAAAAGGALIVVAAIVALVLGVGRGNPRNAVRSEPALTAPVPTTAPSADATPAPEPAAAPTAELRGVDLRDMLLPAGVCPSYGQAPDQVDERPAIQLRGGEGETMPDYTAEGYAQATVDLETAQHIDLDGDGAIETIAIVFCSWGGAGAAYTTPVVTLRPTVVGHPELAAGPIPYHDFGQTTTLDDRAADTIRLEGATLIVDGHEWLDGDPSCCPSSTFTSRWAFQGGAWTEAARVAATAPQDLEAFLEGFLSAWVASDRAAMVAAATPEAIDMFSGGSGVGMETDLVWDPDGCAVDSSGSGECEVLVIDRASGGYALIYYLVYREDDDSFLIEEILGGGDAG